jgi:deazaflavin-dependent oxidoreductase (nitroreductase family)
MRERLRCTWFRLVGIAAVSRLTLRLHPLLYRCTGGRGPLGHAFGNRVVLLTTTGVRSGKPRTVPIWPYPDGETWVVVGSRGGDTLSPGWYHNLRTGRRRCWRSGVGDWRFAPERRVQEVLSTSACGPR